MCRNGIQAIKEIKIRPSSTLIAEMAKEAGEAPLSVKDARTKSDYNGMDDSTIALYENLKALRSQVARTKGVPTYVIFTNETLKVPIVDVNFCH